LKVLAVAYNTDTFLEHGKFEQADRIVSTVIDLARPSVAVHLTPTCT
jgi:hypothetical protein